MSGTATLTLARTSGAATALPQGTDPAALHAAVVAEVGAHLTASHAALFAAPVRVGEHTEWRTTGAELRRFVDLDAVNRRALLGAAGSMMSDVRRLGESGRAPAVAAAWPGLRDIPNPSAVFAVDGRPVLAPWGVAGDPGQAVLAPFDDGRAFVPPPRVDWMPYLAALGAVALLALAAGLLLPWVALWAVPTPAMCRVPDGQLAMMRQQSEAELKGEALKRQLASVNDDIGRRQLQCPLPVVEGPPPPAPPAPRPPAPPPPAPRPPPPRADLPEQRWNDHDVSMLDGCWHSTAQMVTRDETTNVRHDVRSWELCFNHGAGRQSVIWTDGVRCDGEMSAEFSAANQLLMTDRNRCNSNRRWLYRGRFQCTRINDSSADCTRTQTEGSAAGSTLSGRFIR